MHHYQNAIAADVDKVHVLQLAAQRTSRQHRGTSSSFKKQLRSLNKRIDKNIRQLCEWHAVSGDISPLVYDVAELSADSLLEHGCTLPWLTLYQAGSALGHRITDAQQRVQRCSEEQEIIEREAVDTVLFYTHQLTAVQTAIQTRQVAASADLASPVSASLPAQPEASTTAQGGAEQTALGAKTLSQLCKEFRPVMHQHHMAGQLHVLHEYQHDCEHLLSRMRCVSS